MFAENLPSQKGGSSFPSIKLSGALMLLVSGRVYIFYMWKKQWNINNNVFYILIGTHQLKTLVLKVPPKSHLPRSCDRLPRNLHRCKLRWNEAGPCSLGHGPFQRSVRNICQLYTIDILRTIGWVTKRWSTKQQHQQINTHSFNLRTESDKKKHLIPLPKFKT